MLKKIFKIMLCIIAIWITIVAEEESGAPNTLITENPEKEVTTVESLPTRDRAKLSLTVNKIVPKEIMGIYKDGVLEVYLEGKNAAAQPQTMLRSMSASTSTPSTSIANRKLKAYSGNSGAEKIKTMSRFRSNISLEEAFKNAEPNEEKEVEVVAEDSNGTRLAIPNVAEGEKVYLSVMDGDNIVETYSIMPMATTPDINLCWATNLTQKNYEGKAITRPSVGTFTRNYQAVEDIDLGASQNYYKVDSAGRYRVTVDGDNVKNLQSRVTHFEYKVFDKDSQFVDYQQELKLDIEDHFLGNATGGKVTARAKLEGRGIGMYLDLPRYNNGNYYFTGIDNDNSRFGLKEGVGYRNETNVSGETAYYVIDKYPDDMAGGYGRHPVDGLIKVDYFSKFIFRDNDYPATGYSSCSYVHPDGLNGWTVTRVRIKELTYRLDVSQASGFIIGSTKINAQATLYKGNDVYYRDNITYNVDVKDSRAMTNNVSKKANVGQIVRVDNWSESDTNKKNYGLSMMYKDAGQQTKGGVFFMNGTTPVYLSVRTIEGTSPQKWVSDWQTIKKSNGNEIQIRATQKNGEYMTVEAKVVTLANTDTFNFEVVQGRMDGSSLKKLKSVTYALNLIKTNPLGNVNIDVDQRLAQLADGGKPWIHGSGKTGTLAASKDYSRLIYSYGNITPTGKTIAEGSEVEGETQIRKDTGYQYEFFKFDGTEENVGIKYGIDIQNIAENILVLPITRSEIEDNGMISRNYSLTVKDSGNTYNGGNLILTYKQDVPIDGYVGSGTVDMSSAAVGTEYVFAPGASGNVVGNSNSSIILQVNANEKSPDGSGVLTSNNNSNIVNQIDLTYNGQTQNINLSNGVGAKMGPQNITLGDLNNKFAIGFSADGGLILKKVANANFGETVKNVTVKYKYNGIVLGTFTLGIKSSRTEKDLGTAEVNIDSRMKQLSNRWVFIGKGKTSGALDNITEVGPYSDFIGISNFSNLSTISEADKQLQINNVETINSISGNSATTVGNYKRTTGDPTTTPDSAAIPYRKNESTKLTIGEFVTIDNSSMLVVEKNNDSTGRNDFTIVASSTTGDEVAFSGNIDENYVSKSATNITISGSEIKSGAVAGKVSIDLTKAAVGQAYNFNPGVATGTGLNVTLNEGLNLDTTSAITGKAGNKANFIAINTGTQGWVNVEKGTLEHNILSGAVTIGVNANGGLSITKNQDVNIASTKVILEAWYLPDGVNSAVDTTSKEKSIQLSVVEVTISNIKKEFNDITVNIDKRLEQVTAGSWIKFSDKNIRPSIEAAGAGSYENFIDIPQNQTFTTDNVDGYTVQEVKEINGSTTLEATANYKYTSGEKEMVIPFPSGGLSLGDFIKLDGTSRHGVSKSDITSGAVENTFKILATKPNSPSITYSGKIIENYISKGNGAAATTTENDNTVKIGSVAGKASINLVKASRNTEYRFDPGLTANTSSNGILLNMIEGSSLDTRSAIGTINGNIANLLVVKEGSWKDPVTFTNYKNQDISINILSGKIKIGATANGGLLISKLTDENIPTTTIVLEAWYVPTGSVPNDAKSIQLSAFTLTISSLKLDLGTLDVNIDSRMKQLSNRWLFIGSGHTSGALDTINKVGPYPGFVETSDFSNFSNISASDKQLQINSVEYINDDSGNNLANVGNYKRTTADPGSAIDSAAIPYQKAANSKLTITEFATINNNSMLVVEKNNDNTGRNEFSVMASLINGNEAEFIGNIDENYISKSTTATSTEITGSTIMEGAVTGKISIDLTNSALNQVYDFDPGAKTLSGVNVISSEGSNLDTTSAISGQTGNKANFIAVKVGEQGWVNVEKENLKYDILNGAITIGINDNGGLSITKNQDENIESTKVILEAWYLPSDVNSIVDDVSKAKSIQLSVVEVTISNIQKQFNDVNIYMDKRLEQVTAGSWIKFSDRKVHNHIANSIGEGVASYEDFISIPAEENFTSENVDGYMVSNVLEINNETSLSSGYYYKFIDGSNEMVIPFPSGGLSLSNFIKLDSSSQHAISKSDIREGKVENTFKILATKSENPNVVYSGKIIENYIAKENGISQTTVINGNETIKIGAVAGKASIDLIKAVQDREYRFEPSLGTDTISEGIELKIMSGNSLDTRSAIGTIDGNIANALVIKENGTWGAVKTFPNYKKQDISTTILDGKIKIGATAEGGLLISKLTDENIPTTTIVLEAWYVPNGSTTSGGKSIQLSAFTLTISSLKSDLGTVNVKLDDRLSQISTYSWINLGNKNLRNVNNNLLGDYSSFINVENSFETNNYNGADTITSIESINGIVPSTELVGTEVEYKKAESTNEGAMPFRKNATTPLTMGEFIKTGSDSKLMISRWDLTQSNHDGRNDFVLYATRTENEIDKEVRYTGNIQEQYIDINGDISFNVPDSSTTYTTGQGSINLIGLPIGEKFIFSTMVENNKIIAEGGKTEINTIEGTPLNTKGRVGNSIAQSVATNIEVTIGNETVSFEANGEKGSDILVDLSTTGQQLPLKVGVSASGGLVIEKINDNHIPITNIKVEAFYSPDKTLNTGKEIKLGEFTITVKNIIGDLGETEFTVDRRIGGLVSEGEWLSTDGTLKNSQGTTIGVFPELVNVIPTNVDLTGVGTTIVTDVLDINGEVPTDHIGTGEKPSYGYLVVGNEKVALPYGNGVTLNSYDAELDENLLVISTRDLETGEIIGELGANLEVNNTYIVRTEEQRYTGILTENYVGNGVHQGSGTIVFDDKDKGVTYTFPISLTEGDTVTGTNNGNTLIMTGISGSLPNGTSPLAPNQNIADYIEVVNNNQTMGGTAESTTVTVGGITFGIGTNGGLTIARGNDAEIDEEVTHTINFYCKSENPYNTKVLLSSFDLTLKPTIIPVGTIEAKVDIRAKQLEGTHEWLAADGSLYNESGAELGNYSELINTTYTASEGESLVSTNRVTDVYKINGGEVEKRTIGNYNYGVPQGQTTTSSNKIALPYSGTEDITLADYLQATNTSSKFVVSTKNLSDTPTSDLQATFVIETEENRKYEGTLKETTVKTHNNEVPVAGYVGSGSIDLTSLMIGKEYTYAPGGTSPTIANGSDGRIDNTGTMVDARGILNKNSTKNIATKVQITAVATNETQIFILEGTPKPITVGGIDSSIALGISSEGGLTIKKLDEKKIEEIGITLKYIYDPTNNSTTESGIVLGTYTLIITNNVEDIGNFTTKVDPRVLQQRTGTNAFWIYSDGSIGNDLSSQVSNVSSLISVGSSLNQEITFNANSDITYVGDGILPSGTTTGDNFQKFEDNNKEVLGIKNSVNGTGTLTTNVAFATYSSDADDSYNVPIVVNGNTNEKYKLDAVLEYVSNVPVEGYRGKGALRLENAKKGVVYNFAPNGITASNNGVTLNIVEEAGENTMLDASNKVGESGNIANLMKISVDGGAQEIVKANGGTLIYRVTQENPDSLAGDGEVEVGITDAGGLSVKKVTNGNFNKRVKIEYLYEFDQAGGTTAEIKLGEVELQITNEVIDLGEVIYRLDGRYYDGILNKTKNTWLYPNGDTVSGLISSQAQVKTNYGIDKMFTYISSGYTTATIDANVASIIEVVGRSSKMNGDYATTINGTSIKYEAYRPSSDSWNDEMSIPVGKNGNGNMGISELKDYILGAFLNSGTESLYDNIYYIMGSDGKIYVGNIKEEIAGSIGVSHGTGRIDITEIDPSVLHIFGVNSQSGTGVVTSDNGLNIEYTGELLNGSGRVGANTGKNVANKILITNIDRGTSEDVSITSGTTVRIKNLEVGIDDATGGLTIKKITGDGIPENTGGFKFDIEYYFDPTITDTDSGTSTTVGAGAVKLGTFSLDVIDYYIEIEGNNKLEFGNMIYQVTTDPYGFQRQHEYFKVKNLGGKKLSFSVKSEEHGMLHENNTIDPATGKTGEIPLRVVVTDHIYQDQFKVAAEAYLTNTTPSGNYKGTIEITVTIMDVEEGEALQN